MTIHSNLIMVLCIHAMCKYKFSFHIYGIYEKSCACYTSISPCLFLTARCNTYNLIHCIVACCFFKSFETLRIFCHFTVLLERNNCPHGQAVRVSGWKAKGRWFDPGVDIYFHFKFSLPYSSAEPLQMKSSMIIHLQ